MIKKKFGTLLFISLTCAVMIAQNDVSYWRSTSVSTSDNLDAISLNPAGLGVHRGLQAGFHIMSPETGEDQYHFLLRGNGIGFSMYGHDKMNYRIGLGGEVNNSFYFGYLWDSQHIHTLGLISRPNNIVSFGFTYGWNTDNDITFSRLGVAVRPFGHRFTFGADLVVPDMDKINNLDQISDNSDYVGYFEIQPIDGLYLTASSNDKDDYSLQLSLDLGNSAVYSSQTQFDNSNTISEFGIISHTQVQNTFVKKKVRPGSIYYRMNMSDYLIEESPFLPRFNFDFDFNPFSQKIHGTQLRTWIRKLDELTADAEVGGLIIDYKYLAGGFGKLFEVRSALQRFKDAGKRIIVYGESINNLGVYILSVADEIYLAPLGEVDLRGLNLEITFYKGLLDKLDIIGEFEQISPYKTAPDPFLREDMSPEMRENYGVVFQDLYNEFIRGISEGYGWSREETQAVIDNGPYLASEALQSNLIKGTMFPDEFEKYIEEIDGKKIKIRHWDDINKQEEYVHEWNKKDIPKIAIVYAVGGIISGNSNPGPGGSTQMGDKTIMEAIKNARENTEVDAIVFRIDSGGGSALASDMILREINNTTKLDTTNIKPVIASMSDVAGSGGYWIACQADKIVAYPTTITGSIGVLSGRINYSGLLKKIGITSDKIKFGDHSDFYSAHKLWTPEEKTRVRKAIVDIYNLFKEKVADGRQNLEVSDIDEIGLGRIWSGSQAKSNLLIDELGGLSKAVEMAKEAAGIPADQEVEIIEYPKHHDKLSFVKGLQLQGQAKFYLPQEIIDQLDALDIIPVLENDEIQLIMPFTVEIN